MSITNKHNTFGVVFKVIHNCDIKIKATKLNIIDVKPAKGFIKPLGKLTINFKLSASLVLYKKIFSEPTINVDYLEK